MLKIKSLNPREKILFHIVIILFAFYLAYQSIDFLYKNFYNKKDNWINEIEKSIFSKDLEQQKILNHFKYPKEDYLQFIKTLSQQNDLLIQIIPLDSKHIGEKITIYSLKIVANGDFQNLIDFVYKLRYQKFKFQIKTIQMDNIENLKLELILSFLILKE